MHVAYVPKKRFRVQGNKACFFFWSQLDQFTVFLGDKDNRLLKFKIKE